jgi:hypothetical protein
LSNCSSAQAASWRAERRPVNLIEQVNRSICQQDFPRSTPNGTAPLTGPFSVNAIASTPLRG